MCNKWTLFHDTFSGGTKKLLDAKILIAMPEDEARIEFTARFKRDPDHVTCGCCGRDYTVTEFDSVREILEYFSGDAVKVIE